MATRKRGTAPIPELVRALMQDHRRLENLFEQFGGLNGNVQARQALSQTLCGSLTVHAQVEEEVLYPELRKRADFRALVDEAIVEHSVAKGLIAQLEDMQADEPLFDATVTVLGEYTAHHIREEEKEIFPRIGMLDVDHAGMAATLQQRTRELRLQYGLPQLPAEVEARTPAPPPAQGRAGARAPRRSEARHH